MLYFLPIVRRAKHFYDYALTVTWDTSVKIPATLLALWKIILATHGQSELQLHAENPCHSPLSSVTHGFIFHTNLFINFERYCISAAGRKTNIMDHSHVVLPTLLEQVKLTYCVSISTL